MGRSWRVEKHTGNLMELERDRELLEIEMPIELGARLIFLTLRTGQVVQDEMVRIMTGADHVN
jgi:hypothetical protein